MAKIRNTSLKIMFVVVLFLVTICFSACAEIRSLTVTNKDGSIEEIVYISLDAKQVTQANQDILQLQTQIKTDCQNVATIIMAKFLDRIEVEQAEKYAASFDVLLSKNWVHDCFSIRLKFKNQDVYDYYYEIDEQNTIEPIKEHHFLFDKIKYCKEIGYANFAENSLVGQLKEYFAANYDKEILDFSTCKFIYSVEAESSREHSNADFVSKVNGKFYHSWQLDLDGQTRPLVLYYNLANRGNCVLLCVLIGLGVSVILLVVGVVAAKINKMKLKNAPNDVDQNDENQNNI